MKLWAVIPKLYKILAYPRRRKKVKLYRQWVERAGLTPEAIPQEEVIEVAIPKIDKKRLHLNILYILLGVSLGILCIGLILLVVQFC